MPTFPTLSDADDWPRVHALPEPAWAPALAWAGAALGLAGPWARLPGGEDSAVFAADAVVLKLVPPCHAADAAREAAVLPRLDLPVPSPGLRGVAHAEGWTALALDRLPGAPLDARWDALADDARADVLRQVGALLAALWRTPLASEDGDADALLAHLRARAERHEADGFRDVRGFLDRHLPTDEPPALVHLDLHGGNLMLGDDGRLTGALDFVASRALGAPVDLIAPGLLLGRGDGRLLRALLDGAGLATLTPEALCAWHLVHPFSSLPRDLGLAGRRGDPRTAAVAMWSHG